MKGKELNNSLINLIIIAIIIVVNIIAQYLYFKVDLTEDKRYTLTPSTISALKDMKTVVYADVLLEGKFPAGFKRLQISTEEMLRTFKSYYPNLEYKFDDPNAGSLEQRKNQAKILREKGIKGTRLNFKEGDEFVEKYIFPYIILHSGDRTTYINLLEDQLDKDPEITLNKSVSLLEYKMIEALKILERNKRKNILFTTGHGELDKPRVSQLRDELKAFFNTSFINLDSVYQIRPELDLLIVAKPKAKFPEKHVFLIDQYVMNGGKVLWLIDKMETNLDSINRNPNLVPKIIDTGLDDLWYRYGFRIEDDLIIDLESSKIPQVVGESGGKPQTQLFPWFYHILAVPSKQHIISNGIDRVNMKFPSSISTIKTKTNIKKTVLLQSSPYSRLQMYPMQLNFEILRFAPDPKKFNNGNQPVALLLEGEFESLFKNRVPEDVKNELLKINVKIKSKSVKTSQIVVSDADFAKNIFSTKSGKVYPIGFNKWEQKVYPGNKDFLINAINYLTSDEDLLSAKSKYVKLRLLDHVKVKKEQLKWQLINILIPVLFVLLFGWIFNWRRKKKYGIK